MNTTVPRRPRSEPIELRFTDGTTVRVSMHFSPSLGGPVFLVDRNGQLAMTLDDPDAAERLGYALLAQAAASRGLNTIAKRNRSLATAATHILSRVTAALQSVKPAARPTAVTAWIPTLAAAPVPIEGTR